MQTLTSRMGTGGNNVPLVMKIRSGCEGGGKGALIQENKSATLSCNNDQTLFEPCGWDGGNPSVMKCVTSEITPLWYALMPERNSKPLCYKAP